VNRPDNYAYRLWFQPLPVPDSGTEATFAVQTQKVTGDDLSRVHAVFSASRFTAGGPCAQGFQLVSI